ncbi:MAG: hypothetical protein HFH91_08400 [Lachnospiraceae bacterium]|nr:hypothetical protein [Lachnospiraceae bacterium]
MGGGMHRHGRMDVREGKRQSDKVQNGYLTVGLSLCLAVLLSLCLTLIDGVRRNGARLEIECITDIGMHSIMAEYHRELMRQYNLFAIDSSYGTDLCVKANTEAHLRKYLSENLNGRDDLFSNLIYGDLLALSLEEAELTKVSILTDYEGAVFRGRAVDAIKADVGLGLLAELQGWMQEVEVNGLEDGKEEAEKEALDQQIGQWITEYDNTEVETEEGGVETVELDNPTDGLEAKKKQGILKLVLENEAALSANRINAENLIGARMEGMQINRGNAEYEEPGDAEKLAEKFVFQEYLLSYMGRYGKVSAEDALQYQIEYLIAGKNTDADNLKNVANRLCALREAANAMYLLSNEAKRAEIKVAAGLVCTLIMLPELTPLLEGAILLGWAYAESIYDVKSLLAGGKVPLWKDDNSWHYSLSAALEGDLGDSSQDGQGLSYQDYLRIFMMFTDTDILTARAMNMVEADIRKTPGNSAFRLDGCYEMVEARIRIGSSHGFHYEITRKKRYQ